MMGAAHGAVAASYPKTIAPNTSWNTFNPTVGGRRAYGAISTFAAPSFTDTPGWTWPADGPLSCPGYTVQLQLHTDRLEDVVAGQHDHQYAMTVAGVQKNTNFSAVATDVLGPMTNQAGISGAMTFRDFTGHATGNAFVGVVTVLYQYVRA